MMDGSFGELFVLIRMLVCWLLDKKARKSRKREITGFFMESEFSIAKVILFWMLESMEAGRLRLTDCRITTAKYQLR